MALPTGPDGQQLRHTPVDPPRQHEHGEMPDHAPAEAQGPGVLGSIEILLHKLLHVGLLTFHTDVMGAMNHILLRLQSIELALTGNQGQDIESWEVVNLAGQPIDYQGRRHLLVWVNDAVSINVESHGLTRATALSAGWNVLDPPRDARISSPTGTVMLLYRATDDVAPNYA